MPEGVGYGSQYTASTGKELNYIGKHAYAYSGELTLTNSTDITMLDFVSSGDPLKAHFGFVMNLIATSANDIQIKILLNGLVVFNLYETAAIDRGGNAGIFPDPKMIIPPFTNLKVIMRNDENVTVTGCTWISAEVLK